MKYFLLNAITCRGYEVCIDELSNILKISENELIDEYLNKTTPLPISKIKFLVNEELTRERKHEIIEKLEIDDEEWRPFRFGDDEYLVSNYGRIWSNKTKKILKQSYYKTNMGVCVTLSCKNIAKKVRTSRIVADAFVENKNPKKYKYVRHKDFDVYNNHADNLEWIESSAPFGLHPNKASMSVPVLQLDKDLNIVNRFDSITETVKCAKEKDSRVTKYGIRMAIKKNILKYDFYWKVDKKKKINII